ADTVLLVERFFAAAPNSRGGEFSTFAAKVRASHPALVATEWVKRVYANERGAFEDHMRSEGLSNFAVKEIGEDTKLVNAGNRDEYMAVTYIEPSEKNAPAWGFDLASEKTRNAALTWARDADETAMTAPIHLVQGESEIVTLIVHPVYSGAPGSVRERRDQLRGFICAALDPRVLVDNALANFPRDEYQLRITDITLPSNTTRLVDSEKAAATTNQPSFLYQELWTIGGRTLDITIAPTAAYIYANRSLQAWVVLAGGLGLCGLLGAFLLIVSGRTSHIELLVEQRTQELSAILDNASETIITFDDHGYIERANPAAATLFNESRESLFTRRITDLLPQIDWHATPDEDGALEIHGYRRDGTRLVLEMTLSQMDIRGRTLHTAMLHDISARKKAERLKNEFVSTVSHELRTPLTSISGSLGLIAGGVAGEISEDVRELVDIAKINAERLTLLVNDILDLDKLAAGKLDVVCELTDLRMLVRQSLVQNRGYAERYEVAVVIDENDFREPMMVSVDASRMLQVMANLLSNAIKFSPPHKNVEVSLSKIDERIRVGVRDHGPGIPEDFQARIFEKFAQADGADTRARGGTGLGLSISKAIVEQFGGTIGFDVSPGNGTTFYVTLPVARSES
ncbi:MAG TPA: CHASE domain-containing protein, partial [Polyangium sp.]|nr:CHASE domain-containing protein [Polyangium sp.]